MSTQAALITRYTVIASESTATIAVTRTVKSDFDLDIADVAHFDPDQIRARCANADADCGQRYSITFWLTDLL